MMDEENKDSKLDGIQETEQTPEVNQNVNVPKEEKVSEPVQEDIISETTQDNTISEPKQEETKKYETFKPVQDAGQKKTKKKGKKGILISLLVLIIAVVGICAYYYFGIYTNPQTVYKEAIKNGINALTSTTDEEITTMKSKIKLGLNIELEDDIMYSAGEYVEDILDLINNTEIGMEVQVDKEKQQVVYKLDSTYEDEDLIKMNMLIDAKEEIAYMQLEQFFEKLLKIEVDDVETYETLKSAFETDKLTLAEGVAQEKALKIINEEVSKAIKLEYCSKEKEKIEIDSKEVNADAYILEMTGKQLVEEIQNIAENLKDNKDFIKCFENEEEIKEQLEGVIEELEDIEVEDSLFTMTLYKRGIKQETVRVDFKVKENNEVVEVQVTKRENGYNFEILYGREEIISGVINIEKIDENTNKTNTKLVIKGIGKIEIKTETSVVTGEEIDTFDTKNAIDPEDLTEEEMKEAYKKLEESKLYELVEQYVELFTGKSLENVINQNGNKDNNSINTPSSKSTAENQIITYYRRTTINYEIPTGYKPEYTSDTYKTFSKDNVRVSLSSYNARKDEYLESIVDSYMKVYEENSYYKNVTKSEEKTMQVGDKTFDYIELSYEYYNQQYKYIFIYTPINDEEIYTVEVVAIGDFNQSEIESFLKIK